MSKFYRQCFQTDLLDTDILGSLLDKLCVDPDDAKKGDIIAVEFPFSTNEGVMDSPGFPSRALVAQGDGNALRLPWYTMVVDGLDQKRTRMLAEIFSLKSHYWCQGLSDQMAQMDPGGSGEIHFDLMLCSGGGALLRNFGDDHEGMDDEVHNKDHIIQDYIDHHSAIALPPYTSSHARIQSSFAAQKGSAIADIAASLWHPMDVAPMYPAPKLP